MMDNHVFISYCHEDADFAEIVINRIKGEGYNSWVDSDKLGAGEDWRVGIDQAIKDASALIVIMTPDAKISEYVTYEWSFAWGADIKVIPVMLKKTELHPRLGTIQYLDFTNFSTRPWNKLFEALKDAVSLHTSPITPTSQDISPEIVEVAKLLVAAAMQQVKILGIETKEIKPVHEREAETAEHISELITPKASRQLAGASVLWVDDRPENNKYSKQALEKLGIHTTISKSTDNALERLQHEDYNVIISDMGRPPDRQAGYTLLEEIRKRGMTTPFIIYAGSRSAEHNAETRRRGGLGTTNMPSELVEMVVDAIKAS